MDSLQWVDHTYYQKHKSDDPSKLRATYYAELRMYKAHGDSPQRKSPMDATVIVLMRFGRRAAISLAIFALSYLPVIGRFILPAASFYTFNNAVGPIPATVIFGSGLFLPKRYLIVFLQSYFTSRRFMRELVSELITSCCSAPSILKERLSARAILFPDSFFKRAEETLVPRSRRSVIWLRRGLLYLPENSPTRCTYIRNRRGIDRVSDHQNHRSSSATSRRRCLRREPSDLEEQAGILKATVGEPRRQQRGDRVAASKWD